MSEENSTYSRFNRHGATALVGLTAELGVADYIFGNTTRGVLKNILITLYYILFLMGSFNQSIPMMVLSLVLFLIVEVISTIDCFRISLATGSRAFTDRKGLKVRGCKWGLSLAIPRAIGLFFELLFIFLVAAGK